MPNTHCTMKLTRAVLTGKAIVSRPVLEDTPPMEGFTPFWQDMPESQETRNITTVFPDMAAKAAPELHLCS